VSLHVTPAAFVEDIEFRRRTAKDVKYTKDWISIFFVYIAYFAVLHLLVELRRPPTTGKTGICLVSTASGSERVFRSRLLAGDTLATARGTDKAFPRVPRVPRGSFGSTPDWS
jgi:hypothetical protein